MEQGTIAAEVLPAAPPAPAQVHHATGTAAPGSWLRRHRQALAAAAVLAVLAALAAVWLVRTTPGWHTNQRTGVTYFIMDGTRRRARGLYTVDGASYIFDDAGRLVHGWGSCDGHTWYADEAGHPLTGVQRIDGNTYNLDSESGELRRGFYDTDAGRIGYSERGYALRGLSRYEDTFYYFDENGILLTGWFEVDGSRYYGGEDGALHSGWQQIGGATYYVLPRGYQIQRGVRPLDGVYYALDAASGALHRNEFMTDGGATYYADADGVCQTGWMTLDDARYHFDNRAQMSVGYVTVDGALYYFDTDGRLLTGFQTVDGVLCYFGEDGIIRAGAQEYDGATRLFDDHGCILDGWETLAGARYYYVLGIKQTGEREIDGEVYALGEDGILHLGWDGDFYYDDHGYPLTGWQQIDGKRYHFGADGTLTRNTQLDGYNINAEGVATRIAGPGGTVQSCYNYVRRNMRYVRIGPDSYENMLHYALTYHRGACYHYATLLNYYLNQAGIPNTIIWGTNLRTGGTHCWNQLSNGLIVDSCNGYYMINYDQLLAKGYSP